MGGAALFTHGTNFGTNSRAIMGSSEQAASIGSSALDMINSTGVEPYRQVGLAGGGRFMSVDFSDGSDSAVLRYSLADGTVQDVHAHPSTHGRDDMPLGQYSEPLYVPESAEAVELVEAAPAARAHLHVFEPAAEEAAAVAEAGLTPYANQLSPDQARQLAEMSSQGIEMSSSIMDAIGQPGPINPLPPLGNNANVIDGLTVVSRAGWGANEGATTWGPSYAPAQCITVHHAAMSVAGVRDYAASVRGIHSYHAVTQGWGDIGYHLLIDPNGVVYQGRATGFANQAVFQPGSLLSKPQVVNGGHVFNANTGNIGICLLGHLDQTAPSQAMVNSLVRVLGHLCRGLKLDPRGSVRYTNGARSAMKPVITGHRDWADFAGNTSCPGGLAYPLLPGIRSRV